MIEFAGRKIGPGQPPYVIAEMSGNHNGGLERPLGLVEAAAAAARRHGSGELVLTERNLRAIRPGHGLPPKYLREFLRKPAKMAVARGAPRRRDLIDGGGKTR